MHTCPMCQLRGAPCDNCPSISTVSTPSLASVGSCPTTPLKINSTLYLSGALPVGASVAYRTYFNTTSGGSPTGSYTTWSGFTSTSDTLTWEPGGIPKVVDGGATGAQTYYFDIEFAVVGNDGSTICDTGTSTEVSIANVADCAT